MVKYAVVQECLGSSKIIMDVLCLPCLGNKIKDGKGNNDNMLFFKHLTDPVKPGMFYKQHHKLLITAPLKLGS